MNKNKNKKESLFRETVRRILKNRMATLGAIVFVIWVILAILAPYICKYGYAQQDLLNTLQPPSAEHWFGTDEFGRDIFSRVLYGGRYSLSIGVFGTLLAAVFGIPLGAISGYYGGKMDNVLMRVTDVFQSIPSLMLAIALSATLGAGLVNCVIAISITAIPGYARMTRASILNIRGMEYVEAAKSTNSDDFHTIMRHVLPNAVAPILVFATMGVSNHILSAASLSFIGLGVQAPLPEWGAMLSTGRSYIRDYMWLSLFPGLAIFINIMALNLFGDGLRDALDPRLKQ